MPGKKLLKVGFNAGTRKKDIEKAVSVKAGPSDVFACLSVLERLMPAVGFMERWRTTEVPPKDPRYHSDYHEMVFILEGSGMYEIEGTRYPVTKKDVVTIRPGEVHRYTDDSDFECISLHFTLAGLQDLKWKRGKRHKKAEASDEFLEFLIDHYPQLHTVSLVEGSQLLCLAEQVYREYNAPGAGSELMVSASFIQLLVLLARNYLYAKKGSGLLNAQANSRDELMVRQIKRFLDGNFSRYIEPSEVFANYYMHPNHCRAIFKRVAGMSVTHWLLKRRTDEAKRLVLDTQLTLEDVAGACGFKDYFYFLRAFKKAHGVTAGSLRKPLSH